MRLCGFEDRLIRLHFPEIGAKELATAMETGANCSDRAAHLARNLFVRPLFDVSQDDGNAVSIREHLKRRLYLIAHRMPYAKLFRAGRLIRQNCAQRYIQCA